ncbi:MAG: hypothetical protein U1F10_13555 [Burkholderiales bacterium]
MFHITVFESVPECADARIGDIHIAQHGSAWQCQVRVLVVRPEDAGRRAVTLPGSGAPEALPGLLATIATHLDTEVEEPVRERRHDHAHPQRLTVIVSHGRAIDIEVAKLVIEQCDDAHAYDVRWEQHGIRADSMTVNFLPQKRGSWSTLRVVTTTLASLTSSRRIASAHYRVEA